MAAALLQMVCLYRGMLAVRAVGVRPLIPGAVTLRLRAFSVKKEQEPQLEDNPFYTKYADKIKELRNAKPEEFRARMEKREELKTEPLGFSKQAEFVKVIEEELDRRNKSATGPRGFTKNKTLASILNLDMVQDKSGKEVAELWMQYFATKDTISAVIPGKTFEVMLNRAKSCPTFLYALPREEGYEFFLGQWSGLQLHFTSLINVQVQMFSLVGYFTGEIQAVYLTEGNGNMASNTMGENAPSQLILYHYSDLQKDKGIVLMTAEMNTEFIGVHQAQCLANQVQLFYGTQHEETFALVETFNHRPSHFKHMSVIAELEQSGIAPVVSPANT